MERRKRYSRKLQRAAVKRMKSCASADELAKEFGVTRRCLYKWRAQLDHLEPGEKGLGQTRMSRLIASKPTVWIPGCGALASN